MKKILFSDYSFYKTFKEKYGFKYSIYKDMNLIREVDYLVLIDQEMSEIGNYLKRVELCAAGVKIIVFSSIYNPNIISSIFNSIIAFDYEKLDFDENIEKLNSYLEFGLEKKEEVKLSSREENFLLQLSYGLNYKEISYVLSLSERSVRRIKENLFRKTSTKNVQQLLALTAMKEQTYIRKLI